MSDPTKEDDMTIRNKAALIGASVITASALLIASPALAHKNPSHGSVKATASSAVASPTASPIGSPTAAPKAPKLGDKHGHGKGHEGKGPKHGPEKGPKFVTQTVTVDVPETGTYQLLVTPVKPVKATPAPSASPAPAPTASPAPSALPVRPGHSFTVPVTGTGSQTITLKLPHAGEYTVSLVSVVSSQSITAAK
jgi:hypothetical protein